MSYACHGLFFREGLTLADEIVREVEEGEDVLSSARKILIPRGWWAGRAWGWRDACGRTFPGGRSGAWGGRPRGGGCPPRRSSGCPPRATSSSRRRRPASISSRRALGP